MFLSNKQHTQLRTLVMDFEVPYRTYVANEIIGKYRTPESFAIELTFIKIYKSIFTVSHLQQKTLRNKEA